MSLKRLFALTLLLPAAWFAAPAMAEPRPAHETLQEATDELLARLDDLRAVTALDHDDECVAGNPGSLDRDTLGVQPRDMHRV